MSQPQFNALVAQAMNAHREGRLAEAVDVYGKILALRPDIADIHNNLGIVLRQQGILEGAVARFRAALALRPQYAEACNNLGLALVEQGKPAEAVTQYRRAMSLKPEMFQAPYNLGNVLRDMGQLDEARQRFEQALAMNPDYADAQHGLGNVLRDQGRLEEAATHYLRALALKPTLYHAHYNLAVIRQRQEKTAEAIARFREVVAQKPDYAEAHCNLGACLGEQGEYAAAESHCRRALALRPDFYQAMNNLANALRKLDQPEEAAVWLERAIALSPDYTDAIHTLAKLRTEMGQLAAAEPLYRRVLELRPGAPDVYYQFGELKTYTPDDPDLAELERLATNPAGLPEREIYHLHFALGKALEDVGQYDRAFEQWAKANRIKRAEIAYDEAAVHRNLQQVAEVFDADLLKTYAGLGHPSDLPIFIVGMPRSGSTLVEQILAGHPRIHAAGEIKNLERATRSSTDAAGRVVPLISWVRTPSAENLQRLAQSYLSSLPAMAAGETRLTDKLLGNFLFIGLIRLMLPNARIVHTMRDAVDTCLSCFTHEFSYGHHFSYDLGELGRHWRAYNELMDHWRSVIPAGAMLEVEYQNVVDDLEGQARRLIEYCGLEWDERCLNFPQAKRMVATNSTVQVRRPLYRTSLARWRRYERHLGPLLEALDYRPQTADDRPREGAGGNKA